MRITTNYRWTSFLFVLTPILLKSGNLYSQAQQQALEDAAKERYELSDSAVSLFFKGRNVEESIYERISMLLKINDPDFYFAPAYWNENLKKPVPKLTNAEGEHGFALEMRLAQRFKIAPWYAKRNFWMLTKTTVNFDFLYRIARHSDDSNDSPGLPLNTKFGFTIFEHAIPLSQRSYLRKSLKEKINYGFSTDKLGTGMRIKDNLAILVPRIDFMHYSNGQHESALLISPEYPNRNNYALGNFSTNYVQAKVDLSILNQYNEVFNASIGYQKDFPLLDMLSFDEHQKKRYGKHRLLFGLTYSTGPRRNKLILKNIPDEGYKVDKLKYKEGEAMEKPSKKLPNIFEFIFRVQGEYIMDDVKYFNQYRLGVNLQMCLVPRFSTTWSIMYQGFYGRDYLNIRYDLPVFNNMIALTFNFNRYRSSDISLMKKVF